jgi:hypothetical protein
MDPNLLADFNNAIVAMYSGANPDEIQGADRWLQHFGTTPEAWGVVHAVLQDTTMNVTSPHIQFAVKTMHDKICCDIDDLSTEQRVRHVHICIYVYTCLFVCLGLVSLRALSLV